MTSSDMTPMTFSPLTPPSAPPPPRPRVTANPETQHWTALTYATIHGHASIIRLLLEKGANVEGGARLSEDKCTETPLQVSEAGGEERREVGEAGGEAPLQVSEAAGETRWEVSEAGETRREVGEAEGETPL